MTVQPGWYVDPAEPESRRYWDGEGWIGAPIPVDATPPEGPPPAEPTPAPPAAPPSPAPVSAGPGPGPHPGHPGAAQPGPGPWPGPGYARGPGHPQGPPPGWPYPTWPGRPPEPRPHGLPLASYGVRLVARLIDFGILFLLNVAVNGWFVWRLIAEVAPFWQELWRRAETGDTTTAPPPPAGAQTDALWLAIVLIAAALWFAYEVPAMAASGQTFGKRVMRVRAVPIEADQPLGFGRATRRWSTLGLPTLLWYCAGFGLLLQFIDAVSPLFDHPLRQALHDKRAQTVVVQVPRGKPDTRTAPRDRANPPGDTP